MRKGNKRDFRKPGVQTANIASAPLCCISPPPDFSAQELEVWNRVIDSKTAEFWSPCDYDFVRLYCMAVADIDRLQNKMKAEGSILVTKWGPKVNPLLFERERLERKMILLASRLQLTPASRHVVKAEEDGRNVMRKRENAARERLQESDGLLATPILQ